MKISAFFVRGNTDRGDAGHASKAAYQCAPTIMGKVVTDRATEFQANEQGSGG